MYHNWKLFKTEYTYQTEVNSICGKVISQEQFQEYLENYGEVQKIDKGIILETLSDGCSASDYIDLSLDELRKIDFLNEIIKGIENEEPIPFPIFERFPNGDIICLDGRHRLLICLKMNIIPSAIVVDMIPSNEDKKEIKESFLKKHSINIKK